MTTDVITVTPDLPLKEAARLLLERRVSGVPVVDDTRVVGVLSEADLAQLERGDFDRDHGTFRSRDRKRSVGGARTVADVMTTPVIAVSPAWTVAGAAALMLDKGVNRLPVVSAGRLAGIITRADVVRAFARSDDAIAHEVREAIRFEQAAHLDDAPVAVTVIHGEAMLAGTMRRRSRADRIADVAAGVPGVVAVRSDLGWAEDDASTGR
jgi:CBS domain-containing protein